MVADVNSHVSSLITSLSSARFVGTWERDVTTDHVILDRGAAAMMIGDRDFGDRPITLSMAFQCLHPEDRTWVFPKISTISRDGGDFIADYRIISASGVRRLLDKGLIVKRSDGSVRGSGILLDITDVSFEGVTHCDEAECPSPIDLLSSLSALQTHLGGSSVRLRILLDMLRLEIERSGIRV